MVVTVLECLGWQMLLLHKVFSSAQRCPSSLAQAPVPLPLGTRDSPVRLYASCLETGAHPSGQGGQEEGLGKVGGRVREDRRKGLTASNNYIHGHKRVVHVEFLVYTYDCTLPLLPS